MALTAGTRLGVYEVTTQLGVGGMGEVYRATDTKLKRQVAIKILPSSLAADLDRLARFQREAEVLASLNHPNIAAIYGLEDADGVKALVLELVEGPTLAGRIAQGPIPLDEALPIARQVAEALEAAHEQGVIHRDLKPANVKVRPDGVVKVLDFGLAKALEPTSAAIDATASPTITSPAMTRVGVILGTAAYMSPEQARGKAVDRRADIWAFGCVLYEMLTGRLAFQGDDVSITLAAVMMKEPDWTALPAAVPSGLRRLLRLCLERDPKRRLQAIGDARLEIEELLAGEPEEKPGLVAHAPRQTRLLLWAIVAVLVTAVGVSLWTRRSDKSQLTSTLRFTVSPPPDTGFVGTIYHQAVSPDGRQIVFVASRRGEPARLWVRSFDSVDAQLLGGTDSVSTIFWSPDSEFVGFFADGRLKKVSSSGGPVLVVCEAPRGLATGTWSGDVILLGPDAAGGLSVVPAGGGVPKPVTTIDPARGEMRHIFPDFLPDGDRFVYLSQPSNTVYLGALSRPGATEVLHADSKAVYAEPGYLLFIRDAVLLAQPFDQTRAQLTGDPVALAAPVGVNPTNGGGRFSVSDTGVLAYRGGDVGNSGELRWLDRENRPLGSVDRPRYYQALDLSPDGQHLALAVADPPQPIGVWRSEVWNWDLTSGRRVRLSPPISRSPVWSPDGREVAFTSQREDGRWALYRTLGNGTGDSRVFHDSNVVIDVTDWSPDGQTIAFTERHPQTRDDIWFLSTTGGRAPTPIVRTPAREGLAQFSPNGRWLAYVSNESGQPEVYVRPARGSGDRLVISTGGGTLPRWPTDGELMYVDVASRLVSVQLQSVGATLQVGPPLVLFAVDIALDSGGLGWEPRYTLSSDGQRVLVAITSQQQATIPIVVRTNWWAAVRP